MLRNGFRVIPLILLRWSWGLSSIRAASSAKDLSDVAAQPTFCQVPQRLLVNPSPAYMVTSGA